MKQIAILAVLLAALASLWLLIGTSNEDDAYGVLDDTAVLEEGDHGSKGGAALVGMGKSLVAPSKRDTLNGTRTVRVEVVDIDHNPIPGVPVELLRRPKRMAAPAGTESAVDFMLRKRLSWTSRDRIVMDSQITDASGYVTFHKLRDDTWYYVAAVPEAPLVGNETRVENEYEAGGIRLGGGLPVRLVLTTGTPLRVRVVDVTAAGRPARVRMYTRKGEGSALVWDARWRDTDLQGRLRVAAVPGGTLYIDAYVPGVGGLGPLRVTTPHPDEVVLRLIPEGGASVSGTVRGLDDAPVVGATVFLRLKEAGPEQEKWCIRVVRTDRAGQYRFEHLPPGRVNRFQATGEGRLVRKAIAPAFVLKENAHVTVDVRLPRAASISGTVVDQVGAPVEGATVTTDFDDGQEEDARFLIPDAKTDSAGRFLLPAVPCGRGHVKARRTGYVSDERTQTGSDRFALEAPGSKAQVRLRLRGGVPVSGVVVDSRGIPVPGAEVAVGTPRSHESTWQMNRLEWQQADEEGRFRLAGLPRGRTVLMRARDENGFSKATKLVMPRTGDVPDQRLTLEQGGRLSGVLRAARGADVSRRWIYIRASDGALYLYVQTDAMGRFTLDPAPAGTFNVSAWHRGAAAPGGGWEPREVTLAWGERRDDVDLEVPFSATVSGTVVDPSGLPIQGAQVSLRYRVEGKSRSYSEETGAGGHFEFTDVPDHDLVAWVGEHEHGPVKSGDENVRIQVERTTRADEQIEVSVLDEEGQPVGYGSVAAKYTKQSGSSASSSCLLREGRGTISLPSRDDSRPCTIKVERADDIFGRPLNSILPSQEIEGALPRQIGLQLSPALRITGLVVSEQGTPIVGATVRMRRGQERDQDGDAVESWGYRKSVKTDAEGRFVHERLESGRYALGASATDGDWRPSKKRVAEAGAQDVRLVLPRGARIEGYVETARGLALQSADVSFTWEGPEAKPLYANTRSKADGWFQLKGLPPGVRGRLRVSSTSADRDGTLPTTQAGVAAGTHDVRMRMDAGARIEGTLALPHGISPDGLSVSVRSLDEDDTRGKSVPLTDLSFRSAPLTPGRYLLRFHSSGQLPAPEPIEVVAPADGLVVRFDRGSPLHGIVRTKYPRNVKVTWITYEPDDGYRRMQRTPDQQGRFAFGLEKDEVGTLHVADRRKGTYALLEGVRASEGPFELELRAGLEIRGRVEGPRPTRYGVTATGPGGCQYEAWTDWDGAFHLTGLAPGSYTLTADSGAFEGHKEGVVAGTMDLMLPAAPSAK